MAFPAQLPRSQGNFPGVTEALPRHRWLLLLGALLRRVSQEEVVQGALRGTWCSGTGLARKEMDGNSLGGKGQSRRWVCPKFPMPVLLE